MLLVSEMKASLWSCALASVAHASAFIGHLLYARPYGSRMATDPQTQVLFSACSLEERQTEEQGHMRKN